MDTPEKKAQTGPFLVPKIEDSPVFNYISNLSPITPFISSRSEQSFNVLGFTSPQCLKSPLPTDCPEESKIKRGTHVSDVAKNNCSQKGSEEIISGALRSVTQAIYKSDSTQEITVKQTNKSSNLVTELPESLNYDSGSSGNNLLRCRAGKPDCEFEMARTRITSSEVIQDASHEADCSSENEMGVQGIPLEENNEVCNWERFICAASDNLNCETPAKDKVREELDDKSVDPGTLSFVSTVLQPPNDNIDETEKLEYVYPVTSSESQDVEVPFSQPGMGKPNRTNQVPTGQTRALFAEEIVHYSSTEVDGKQQVTRRRCLIYEMSGSHYKKLVSDPADSSPTLKDTSVEKGEVANRPGGSKFSSLLPGIGLHLNALAATTREKIIVKRQTLTCRRQLISSPGTVSSIDALTSDTNSSSASLASDTAGMSRDGHKDAIPVIENVDQDSILGEPIEFLQCSPNKKRQKSENVGETDSCKRCNCKRSKCLKLYCECFAAGLYCVEPCSCQDCFNKPIHEEMVLETRRQIESRNPLAFAPKVIRCSSTPYNGDELNTPASARHKRGCNCKKSGCLKKYCECFQGGVGCSLGCRCEGCKNTFGRKEGHECIIFEEHAFNRGATDAGSYDTVSETVEDHQEQETPEPSINMRSGQPVRRPFHFGGNASYLPSTLQSCTTHRTDKSDETCFEEDLNIMTEDEAPTVLTDDYTLPTCVKSTSPNSKRVSPPHYDIEPSPGWRSCRKLILRSISSLPTTIPEKKGTELRGKIQ